MGAGSWTDVGAIPLDQVAPLYESLDQARRIEQYNRAIDRCSIAAAMGVKNIHPPDPSEFGVLNGN